MIDAGYVSFSGEGSDEDIGVTALRLIGLIVGLLFLVLPLNILVSGNWKHKLKKPSIVDKEFCIVIDFIH